MPQNSSGCFCHHLRARHDAVDGHGADHQRHHGVRRDAEREQRNERGLRRRVVGAFRRRHAFDRAAAEPRRILRDASSRTYRPRTTRSRAPPPGRMPRIDPRIVPRTIAPDGIDQVLLGRHQPGDLLLHEIAAHLGASSRLRMISAKPNTPIATVAKPRPSASSGMLKAMRDGAGLDVGADHRQQQPGHDHRDRLRAPSLWPAPPRRSGRAPSARNIRPGPNSQRELGQRRAERRDQHGRRRSRRRTSRSRRSRAPDRRGPACAI